MRKPESKKSKKPLPSLIIFVAVLFSVRHVHLPSLSLYRGTSLGLVGIDLFSMPRFVSADVQKSLLPQQS